MTLKTPLLAALLALVATGGTSCDRTRIKIVEKEKRIEVPAPEVNRVTVTLWDETLEKALVSFQDAARQKAIIEEKIAAKSAAGALEPLTPADEATFKEKIADLEKTIDIQLHTLDVAKADDIFKLVFELEALKKDGSPNPEPKVNVFTHDEAMRLSVLILQRDRSSQVVGDIHDTLAAIDMDPKLDLRTETIRVITEGVDPPGNAAQIAAIEKVLKFKLSAAN